MKSKGSFSAIVGLSLIVLLSSIAVAFYSNSLSQSAFIEQQNSLELRQRWTEARFMLDKTAAKALYNLGTGAENCVVEQDAYANMLAPPSGYFGFAMQVSESNGKCEIQGFQVTKPASNFIIDFDLNCSKGGAFYLGEVHFEKSIVNIGPADSSDCQVTDVQGNFVELP